MDKIDRFFIQLNIWALTISICVNSCSISSLKDRVKKIELTQEQILPTQVSSTDSLSTTLSDTIVLQSADIPFLD